MLSTDWMCRIGLAGSLLLNGYSFAQAQPTDEDLDQKIWNQNVDIPVGGRSNPYELDQKSQKIDVLRGKIHTQLYPVEVTGLLAPTRPIENFIQGREANPLLRSIQGLFSGVTNIRSFDGLMKWVGLHPYPRETDQGVYGVPYPQGGARPDFRIGFTPMERFGARGFTISCAACHSSQLFGKTVLGLSNRFPRANEVFIYAKLASAAMTPASFQYYSGATKEETDLFRQFKFSISNIGAKKPQTLGLDTSLAQVALSLAHREDDPWASQSLFYSRFPRHDDLETYPGDSKPAVWWNLKYKNRWLSDGSVISGNPIFTNILWNEIGRGAELRVLDSWLNVNKQKLRELTTAVFSIEPPQITDFFPAEKIDIAAAKRGQKLFLKMCSGCHGTYEKNWDFPQEGNFTPAEKLKTSKVLFKTKIVDVGTDPYRRLMMKSLEKLNDLEISKRFNTVIQAQQGYVAPPLVGIWARWPYFHNNSVPSLCALLSMPDERPKFYYSGEAVDPQSDFDFDCNGYPLGNRTPENWKVSNHLYDTSKMGLSNQGHSKNYEQIGTQERRDLIRFLQTL